MKAGKKGLKNDDIQLLRTGMNDNANLLNDDELGEIFGGYTCEKHFCEPSYSNEDCAPLYCGSGFRY